jgi:cation transport ATPase
MVNGRVEMAMAVSDTVRPAAMGVIAELHRLKVSVLNYPNVSVGSVPCLS